MILQKFHSSVVRQRYKYMGKITDYLVLLFLLNKIGPTLVFFASVLCALFKVISGYLYCMCLLYKDKYLWSVWRGQKSTFFWHLLCFAAFIYLRKLENILSPVLSPLPLSLSLSSTFHTVKKRKYLGKDVCCPQAKEKTTWGCSVS